MRPRPIWVSAALDARRPLPDFYWTGDTEMACLRDTIGQTLRLGYRGAARSVRYSSRWV